MALLEVQDLSVGFLVDGQLLPAVSNVSFTLGNKEILALVGESGCGKSVSCLALARLVPEPPGNYSSGKILLHSGTRDYNVLQLPPRRLREFRRDCIAYIFQEPSSSLNPVFRIEDQIGEAILLRQDDCTDINREIVALLRQVGIPEPEMKMHAYPHELSGGMQQRAMIAMALAGKPPLLVADEPTTALDVTIQAQILELLQQLRHQTGMAIILVTHNLGIVADMADRVIVMYAGHTVEAATTRTLLREPRHPYTRALLEAVPKLGRKQDNLKTIPGTVPAPANYPQGCRFYGRCTLAASLSKSKQELCINQVPAWREIGKGHCCRCHYSK